jgi:hypothetical protein
MTSTRSSSAWTYLLPSAATPEPITSYLARYMYFITGHRGSPAGVPQHCGAGNPGDGRDCIGIPEHGEPPDDRRRVPLGVQQLFGRTCRPLHWKLRQSQTRKRPNKRRKTLIARNWILDIATFDAEVLPHPYPDYHLTQD